MEKDRVSMKETGHGRNIHISYDQKLQPYHCRIAELVSEYSRPNGNLLDIGCGVGHTLKRIRKLLPDIALYAADIDDETLGITANRVNLAGTLKIDSVEDIIESNRKFDTVILSHSLEHMRCPLDIIEGVMSILEPGGLVIIAVPNPGRLNVFLGNLVRRHYANPGHMHAWDRSHFMNFLENIAGLNVIRYSHDYFPLPLLHGFRVFQPLEKLLAHLFPWLSFSNIAVIRSDTSSVESGSA